MTSEELDKMTGGLDAGVVWSCNMAHERIARVILASGRCLERSSANDYQSLTRCIKSFSAATEAICGKKTSHVWSALQGQVGFSAFYLLGDVQPSFWAIILVS
jgi:hypothetical protein